MSDFEGFEWMEMNSNLVFQVSLFSIGIMKITSWEQQRLNHVASRKKALNGVHASGRRCLLVPRRPKYSSLKPT